MAVMALVTFALRRQFPIGACWHHFQRGHFGCYLICLGIGIRACRGRWFEQLSVADGRRWGCVALGALGFLPLASGASMAAGRGPEVFFGGWTTAAGIAALWESLACLSIIMWLSGFFKQRFYRQGRILVSMSSSAFSVYIIHELVLTTMMALLFGLTMPRGIKFGLVAAVGLPLCFLLSQAVVRRLPLAKRVLG